MGLFQVISMYIVFFFIFGIDNFSYIYEQRINFTRPIKIDNLRFSYIIIFVMKVLNLC